MRIATIEIKGLTPYSPSKAFQSEKKPKESHEEFDKRCWREHAHVNKNDEVVIPAEVTRKAIIETAEFLGKGGFLQKKGAAKWTENFQRGLAVTEGSPIGHTVESMSEPELVYCHADGNPKSGKRVWRRFPFFREWEATLTVHILDDSIPEEIFNRVIDEVGVFNGFGRSSPRTKGQLGRFIVEKCTIAEV